MDKLAWLLLGIEEEEAESGVMVKVFCFVQCHTLQLGNTETLSISIGTLQPLNEAVPSAPLPLGCILKSHSQMLLTPYRNTSELFTPQRSVL